MKKPDTIIREYVTALSDANLQLLHSRFKYRYGGDMGEALEFISAAASAKEVERNVTDMDKWLHNAKTSASFYDAVDLLAKGIEREHLKRYGDVPVIVN